jgi:hypothetical protein
MQENAKPVKVRSEVKKQAWGKDRPRASPFLEDQAFSRGRGAQCLSSSQFKFFEGDKNMCDYSLMAIPNRLAVSGEELIVHRFEAGSVGLASAFDLRKRQECRRVQSHGF